MLIKIASNPQNDTLTTASHDLSSYVSYFIPQLKSPTENTDNSINSTFP